MFSTLMTVTIGGPIDAVMSDLKTIREASCVLGLSLNISKCEAICVNDRTESAVHLLEPSLRQIEPDNASLLGSPIGGLSSIDSILEAKIGSLQAMEKNLRDLQAHDALCLLRHAFSLPKILYVLRTAPCFRSDLLQSFDSIQISMLESICNVQLDMSSCSWLQASLPVNAGGLRIRSAVMLAPSAYLASAAGCSEILKSILPNNRGPTTHLSSTSEEALQVWKIGHDSSPPSGLDAYRQKNWDSPIVDATFQTLLAQADTKSSAHLHAAHEKESGAWLTAPPVSALGLRMSNEAIRVAVGLRLGVPLCTWHICQLCGSDVDESGTHGLSCRRSKGQIPRHSGLNHVVHRALEAIQIPSTLEPRGLYRTDGRRPDGLSLIPWSQGRALVWDATCHDTFAKSNLQHSSIQAGAVAEKAAAIKCRHYADLRSSHYFVPLAFESSGVFGQDALSFFKDLACRSRAITQDPLSYIKLCQRVSVTIQNFNTASILGTCVK